MTRIRLNQVQRRAPRKVFDELAEEIRSGRLPAGRRLPTEQELTRSSGASRTVVREAVAALRAEGLVITQQGRGSFVAQDAQRAPFRLDAHRLRSLVEVVQVMELRRAVEIESAGLAAERASAAQLKILIRACDAIDKAAKRGQSAADEDLAFHRSVAEATGNPQFVRFLQFLGHHVIPRARIGALQPRIGGQRTYLAAIQKEHRLVLDAISKRDPQAARRAMRSHLTRALERYRSLAAEPSVSPSTAAAD